MHCSRLSVDFKYLRRRDAQTMQQCSTGLTDLICCRVATRWWAVITVPSWMPPRFFIPPPGPGYAALDPAGTGAGHSLVQATLLTHRYSTLVICSRVQSWVWYNTKSLWPPDAFRRNCDIQAGAAPCGASLGRVPPRAATLSDCLQPGQKVCHQWIRYSEVPLYAEDVAFWADVIQFPSITRQKFVHGCISEYLLVDPRVLTFQ